VLHFDRWKIIAISLSVLLAAILCLPNVLPTAQQTSWANYGLKPMTLGLDLQGGSDIKLELDRADMTKKLIDQAQSDVVLTLRDAGIARGGIRKLADGVTVGVKNAEDKPKAKEALSKLLQPIAGGVLSGGATIDLFKLEENAEGFKLAITEAGLSAKILSAIEQTQKILAYRIDPTGTKEIAVQQIGQDRIGVQWPGLGNSEELKKRLSKTAKLTFQLLCNEQPYLGAVNVPPNCNSYPVKPDPRFPDAPKVIWAQTTTNATVDGADLTDAKPSFDDQNRPAVSFSFNQRGALRLTKLTAANIGKQFAIILDDEVQSYPEIQAALNQGGGIITGNFSVQETGELSVILKSGALPAKLTVVEERAVGPSLGADSVRAGFVACAIGLIGVMAFMFLPYGFFGFVANLALLANLLLLIACMSFFGFTLTLPGIAGILLTLGMAVDSNVLIYERIREEWRNGRTALSSIETGFKSALGTVLDANITTLIAAVVLFGVGSGPVRGFAVTLAIGIFTTMFTAFTVTRMLVAIWVKRARPKEINL
jgi:protein-export membrane protein SecD